MWTFVSPPQEKSSQDSREKKKKRERKKLPTKQEISSDPSSIISPSKPCEKFRQVLLYPLCKYRNSPVSAVSISAVPGLVQFATCLKFFFGLKVCFSLVFIIN